MARVNFAQTNVLQGVAGDVAYVLGFFVALIMWGFGLAWLVFALASIYKSRPFHFNMGWWGFTFPLGVFCISTITIGEEMSSVFFKVLGTVQNGTQLKDEALADLKCRFSVFLSSCCGWLSLWLPAREHTLGSCFMRHVLPILSPGRMTLHRKQNASRIGRPGEQSISVQS